MAVVQEAEVNVGGSEPSKNELKKCLKTEKKVVEK